MPEQRISQIQVRVGDLQDLPILATGEFGYAEYENRLFIGNPPVAVGTGNGTDVTFNVPALSSFLVPASSVEKIVFYVDGTERNDITLNPTTVTFVIGTRRARGAQTVSGRRDVNGCSMPAVSGMTAARGATHQSGMNAGKHWIGFLMLPVNGMTQGNGWMIAFGMSADKSVKAFSTR